jgi:hypothetical protein
MLNLSSFIFGRQEQGLPPSLLRPNSGAMTSTLLDPINEEQAHENINAAAWSKRFAANFIEPGLVLYKGKNGEADERVLIENDALERMSKSLIGKPVIDWDHAEVWPEILGDGQADGVVYDVWRGDDGWWHCGYVLWTKSAIEHAESGDWSVSCAYSETETDGAGRYHNDDYDTKILNGIYTHLAQVKKPRYEKARIRANSTETNGGFKMGWKLFEKKPDNVLRLNAAEAGSAMLEVDGEPVAIADLVAKHNALSAAPRHLTASDDDMVEHEGKQYKVGELRNAHRNAMQRQNADDVAKKEKEEKDKKDRENAARLRANAEPQLKGSGSEPTGKLPGAEHDKITGVDDNPDKGVEAAKEIAKLKERLNAAETEVKELKAAPSRELRDAANLRVAPIGGETQDRGFITMEDRIRQGNLEFSLSNK